MSPHPVFEIVNVVLPAVAANGPMDVGLTAKTGIPEPAWVTERVIGLPVAPGAEKVIVHDRDAQLVLAW
jgi:hypothetical protein